MEISPSFKIQVEILGLPVGLESRDALERDARQAIALVLSQHQFELEKALNARPGNGVPTDLTIGDLYQLFDLKLYFSHSERYYPPSYELRLANLGWLPDTAFKEIVEVVTAKVSTELIRYSPNGSYVELVTLASTPVRFFDKTVPEAGTGIGVIELSGRG